MKNSTNLVAFISAFSLHLVIGGVLLMSVEFELPKNKPKESVTIIEASVVSQKMFDDLAKLKEDKKREEQRILEEARLKKEREKAEKERQAALLKKQAEERIAAEKAELLRKKMEAERIEAEKALAAKRLREKQEAEKAAEALKQKQLAEKKEQERIQAEKIKAEKLAAEKAAKELAIKKAKEKAEKEAAAEKERQRQAELDKQMEAEFFEDFTTARTAKQLSEIAKYEALIRGKISRNWKVDPTMKGSSCTLAIKLAPDGLVISAQMSRGDRKLCDSARRAALQAKTLPIPKDPEIAPQFRDFDITLEPEF